MHRWPHRSCRRRSNCYSECLLPQLINALLNRRRLAREPNAALVLLGIDTAGRVRGMQADKTLRDKILCIVDTIVRYQRAMNGVAGALSGDDVVLEFAPVVRPDAATGALVEIPDQCIGELRIESCATRCPIYSYIDANKAEISFERLGAGTVPELVHQQAVQANRDFQCSVARARKEKPRDDNFEYSTAKLARLRRA